MTFTNIKEDGIKETAANHDFKTEIIEQTSECKRGIRIISPTIIKNGCRVDIVIYPDDPNLTYTSLIEILEHMKKYLDETYHI